VTAVTDPISEILDLDSMRDDERAAVRRRVSERLAALARTHPTLALATAQRWLAEGGRYTESVVRRGLKPLVDARDDTALRLAGYSPSAAARVVDLWIDEHPAPAFGGHLRFSARVVSAETRAVPALVEYRIEHRNGEGELRSARGRMMARVLDPLTDTTLRRAHRLPRRPSLEWVAGPASLVVAINARDDATLAFTLETP